MKKTDFLKRMVITNPEIINQYFEKGRSVVILTMHYNNWEWSNSFPFYLKHRILGVYKPLQNPIFDKFMNKSREKPGNELVQNSNIMKRLIKAKNSEELVLTWLAADQTPPYFHKFWLMFMNQETLFYHGPCFIPHTFNHPLFFQKITKKERGMYESSFELLYENPRFVNETEIMKSFIGKMEEVIKERPEFYLWSHKRWKHKRPENIQLHQ